MSEHECSGTDCASLVRIKALERTLEDEKKERSRSHEKIYNRLGALERGMTAVTTQYSQIIAQLATMSADINALKEKPNKRWETVITAIITGVVGFLHWPGLEWGKGMSMARVRFPGAFLTSEMKLAIQKANWG